ncbi:hypothetical protein C8R43DRAFT_1102435 [Mycena crocata]|nr:hypothetical protein C8R43DRAFT_1102435 [Mycena crocata]
MSSIRPLSRRVFLSHIQPKNWVHPGLSGAFYFYCFRSSANPFPGTATAYVFGTSQIRRYARPASLRHCTLCQEIGHYKSECPQLSLQECPSCHQVGHSSARCPNRPCPHCNDPNPGHAASKCPQRPCFYCSKIGHVSAKCPAKRIMCIHCGDRGKHLPEDCPIQPRCRSCWEEGHGATECPWNSAEYDRCLNCKQHGHRLAACPEPLVCPICGADHWLTDCPKTPRHLLLRCSNCKEHGHTIHDCPLPLKCPRCGGEHWLRDCTGVVEDVRREVAPHLARAKAMAAKAATNWPRISSQLQMRHARPRRVGMSEAGAMSPVRERGACVVYLSRESRPSEMPPLYAIQCSKVIFPAANGCRPLPPLFDVAPGWEPGHFAAQCPWGDAEYHRCRNCRQLGHLISACPEPLVCRICGDNHWLSDCPQTPRSLRKCKNCKENGHTIHECPKPLRCPRCGGEHWLRECTAPDLRAEAVPAAPPSPKCSICNELGHVASKCPQRRRIRCRQCGRQGHKRSRCPENSSPNTTT